MDTKNIIKKLEEEMEWMDLRQIKINSIIKDLKEIGEDTPKNNTKDHIKKSIKKREYKKSGNYKIKKQMEKLDNSRKPQRALSSGKIITPRKRLFPEEIDNFMEKKWASNIDIKLRELIGDKFNIWYTAQQLKSHRKLRGWISDKRGRRTLKKRTDITNTPDKELNPVKRKLKEELKEEEDLELDEMEEILNGN